MRITRELTKYQGVYQRQFKDKRDHRDGKPDVCYDITYRANGRKVWEKVGWKSEGFTAQTAREIRVERMRAALNGPQSSGEAVRPKVTTLEEAWRIYREKWVPGLAQFRNTIGRYQNHIAPRFGDRPLKEITPLDLEGFKRDLLDKGLAAKTVHHILCLLGAIYRKMMDWELYEGSVPTAKIKMPRVDNARVRYLTVEEADRLLGHLKSKNLTIWRLAAISLNSGLRLGEILSLTYGDLDLAGGVIHVRDAKTGTRMVQMNETMKELFASLPPGSPSALLFPNRKGDKQNHSKVGGVFAKAVAALKFNENVSDARQKLVFHSLRHTFASWLAIDGVPLYTISELMGHAKLEMTRRYAHLCPDTKREAVARIAEMGRRLNSGSWS